MSKCLFFLFFIFTLTVCQDDYDAKLHEQVVDYMKKNNLTEKETISRKDFVEMFMNVISNGQTHSGNGGLFEKVANKLVDKVGKETVPTKDIDSLFNLTEMTLMYAELSDDDDNTKEDKGDL